MTKAEIYEAAITSVVASCAAEMMSGNTALDLDKCMELSEILIELKGQYDFYAAPGREDC